MSRTDSLLKICFTFAYVWMCTSLSTDRCPWITEEGAGSPMELKLQEIMSCPACMLGTEPVLWASRPCVAPDVILNNTFFLQELHVCL